MSLRNLSYADCKTVHDRHQEMMNFLYKLAENTDCAETLTAPDPNNLSYLASQKNESSSIVSFAS